jgi:hypothetical protein
MPYTMQTLPRNRPSHAAFVVLLFASTAPACGSAKPDDDPYESQSEAIGVCGSPPHVGVCDQAICSSEDHTWDIVPRAAGTKCNTTGTCDGNSKCVMPSTPPPTPRVIDFVTAPVTEIQVDITAGQPITFETRNCSAGADPVLHLFKPGVTSEDRTELAVDDNGAGGVDARISLTPSSGGIGVLLLHAQADATGTCSIYRNGLPWQSGLSAGGKTINIVAQTNDAVETVTMPGGRDYQAIYLVSGARITKRVSQGTGTGTSARFVMNSITARILVDSIGPSRVIVNDEGFDSDGDGLGNRLELELGTCSVASGVVRGFDCSRVTTPKDTDGDGLSDGWEVLGKRDQWPHQLLPFWGSNPRHKDMFVEVDFLTDGQAPLTVSADVARQAAAYWQDTIEPLTPTAQSHRAALLMNPDGLPGVSLHIDSGISPVYPEDSTLYGNWGGYDVVPANTGYATAWSTWMNPARRGVFRWVLGARTGGGQTSGFASTASIKSGDAIAHELGHTTGLEHFGALEAGALNCKPQYASPMNYAYSNVGFSDDLAPGPMNNIAVFENGNLLNVANRSHYADLYEKVFQYRVDRTTWSVDFNRDGEFAPAGVAVRAYANSMPAGQCEGVRERQTRLTDGGFTSRTPSIVRSSGKFVVFAATGDGLEMRVGNDTYFNCATAGGGDGNMPCGTFGHVSTIVSTRTVAVDAVNVQSDGKDLVVFTFVDDFGALRSGTVSVASGTPLVTIDAAPISTVIFGEPAMVLQGPNMPIVVFKVANGVLRQARFIGQGWAAPGDALSTSLVGFSVSDAPGMVLGRMPGDTADAVYMQAEHNISGTVKSGLLKLDNQGHWAPTPYIAGATNMRPGMAYVPDVADPSKGKLYSVYVERGSSVLRMQTSGVKVTGSGSTLQKTPVFGFDATFENGWTIDATFDNGWTKGFGIDLMFEPGKDTNVRAAVAYSFGPTSGKITVLPLADGIVDLSYGSFNDWGQIAKGLCSGVANPGGLVSNPITCR